MDAGTRTPLPRNEPVRDYAPGSTERESLFAAVAAQAARTIELPATIDGHRQRGGGDRRGRPL